MKKKWLILYIISALFILSTPAVYSYFSPKITSQPALDPHEGAVFLIESHPFPYQPEVRYDINVTWHLTIPPTTSGTQLKVSINPETGEILWNDERKGIWQVTVTASNWAGRDSQTFKVKRIIKPFIKINLPSTITAQQDFKGSLEVSGSQPLEISCSNPDIVIEDFTINWPAPKAGKYSIQFAASNPAGKHKGNWNVTVKGTPVKITSKPQKTTTAGTDYKYKVKATGTPEFQWQLEDAPEGMSIGRKGIVLWPADSATEGNYTVNIKVSNIIDGKTHTDTQTFTLQCKKKKEEKVEKQKKKKSKKLTNVKIKRVFKEDKIIKKQKKIIQDQEKLLEKLPKQFKPEQKKAIDAQKEAIKRAEEAKKRALQLKKLKAEEERLEAERKEKERQRVEAEKLKEILRQQEEAERQRALDAQKVAEQRETERQRLLNDQREKERQEALRKEQETRKKQEKAREKYLKTQREVEEEARKKEEAIQRQKVIQKKARKAEERVKREEAARQVALRKRQKEANRRQEESKRKYLQEQQRLREASKKARLEQEKVAEKLRKQKKLMKQAEEAEKIAKRQRRIEEELRKQRMTKNVSVPTKRDMSREKVEKGKKIDLRYDFVMTRWSFADFSRLVKSREFKILFMPRFKSIQSENYEVTGLDNNGNPVVKMKSWDSNYYSSKGCIVAEIPTEGKDRWRNHDIHLRRKHKRGSYTMTLFFPYHFFTYLEDAARSYYEARKLNPAIPFKKGAGKIKFTITKNYKFKIISMGNTK